LKRNNQLVVPDVSGNVAESIPLKQGLKHCYVERIKGRLPGCGEHSIKTRIETLGYYGTSSNPTCCGEHSIKTRIETCYLTSIRISARVAESIPLKQGLKHTLNCGVGLRFAGCGEHSIKTRIETRGPEICRAGNFCCGEHSIKTRIETLLGNLSQGPRNHVAESIPLKQGLKLADTIIVDLELFCCGEHSIKTRIETRHTRQAYLSLIAVAESIPLKQGLKRGYHTSGREFHISLRRAFH